VAQAASCKKTMTVKASCSNGNGAKKNQHPAKKSFPQKVVSTAAPHACSRFFLLAFVGTIVGTTSYPWVLPHFAIGICVIFAAVSGLTLLHQKQGATVT